MYRYVIVRAWVPEDSAGTPSPPIYLPPGYPDQGLPPGIGGGPIYPEYPGQPLPPEVGGGPVIPPGIWPSPGRPGHPIYRPPGRPPVDPGFGLPLPPGYPDQGLPGYPDQGLPPEVGGGPILPPGSIWPSPGRPSHPIYRPGRPRPPVDPDYGIPHPGYPDQGLPPGIGGGPIIPEEPTEPPGIGGGPIIPPIVDLPDPPEHPELPDLNYGAWLLGVLDGEPAYAFIPYVLSVQPPMYDPKYPPERFQPGAWHSIVYAGTLAACWVPSTPSAPTEPPEVQPPVEPTPAPTAS